VEQCVGDATEFIDLSARPVADPPPLVARIPQARCSRQAGVELITNLVQRFDHVPKLFVPAHLRALRVSVVNSSALFALFAFQIKAPTYLTPHFSSDFLPSSHAILLFTLIRSM
jgi:hypothetical protein